MAGLDANVAPGLNAAGTDQQQATLSADTTSSIDNLNRVVGF